MKPSILFTCEHAGNEIPEEYQSLFAGKKEVLESHRGWDPGAWPIATYLATQMKAPLFGCLTSRLLVEANRSLESVQLFSEFTSALPMVEKERLIQKFYKPYRDSVMAEIAKSARPIVHLSIHSFTPIWNNEERKVDVGILFDPERNSELTFSKRLKENLQHHAPTLQILFNEPYQGTDDGFTMWLRRKYTDTDYAGIEIEVNQKFTSNLTFMKDLLLESIRKSVN